MKEGDTRAKSQKKAVAPTADNSRKTSPSLSVHESEATNVARECPVGEVTNTNY
jgi:hypothetical protein